MKFGSVKFTQDKDSHARNAYTPALTGIPNPFARRPWTPWIKPPTTTHNLKHNPFSPIPRRKARDVVISRVSKAEFAAFVKRVEARRAAE
ncbi:MAG: hypothetical protein K8U57_05635 [Planctomycetes bacterium]|nr:hypothetical protein [Planctomycetota bacterium]